MKSCSLLSKLLMARLNTAAGSCARDEDMVSLSHVFVRGKAGLL